MAGIFFKSLSNSDPRYLACTIEQGTAFYFDCKPKDDNGDPIDTTGWSFTGQFRSAFERTDITHFDGKALLTFQQVDGNVINDPANKRFVVLFPSAETSAIKFKGEALEGVYDFELASPDGTRIRAMYGPFTLTREVTTV
jgi:hypothetical protein